MEEWKDIEGFPNYQVSSFGRIKRVAHFVTVKRANGEYKKELPEQIIKPQMQNSGYLMVNLYRGGRNYARTVHRLVAGAFLANPGRKPQVNHKDGNKQNNIVDNLEYMTNAENQLHKVYVLGRLGNRTDNIPMPVLCVETGVAYESIRKAHLATGACADGIRRVVLGNARSSGGYHWKRLSREEFAVATEVEGTPETGGELANLPMM